MRPSDGSQAIERAAGVAVLCALAVFALEVATQTESYPLLRINFGYDFRYIYDAALSGNPYSVRRYVFPPTFLLIAYPLARLEFQTAAALVSLGSLAGMVVSLVAVYRYYYGDRTADQTPPAPIWVAFLLLSSYPVYFLVDRGNIDGLICALVWLGLLAGSRGRDLLGGSLWGLAVALKVYPLLLIIPLVLARKLRFLAAGALVLLLAVAAQPDLFRTYASTRLLQRASLPVEVRRPVWRGHDNLTNAENGSFAAALVPLGLSFRQLQLGGAALTLALLILNVVADLRRRNRRELLYHALPYVLLSVTVPATVYLYEYVTVLPAILVLGFYAGFFRTRLLLAATVALALSQAFSYTLAVLLRTPSVHSLSACALLAACVLVTLHRWNARA